MRTLVLVFAVAACVQPHTVTCDDGRLCPSGLVCDLAHQGCVTPFQFTSCSDAGKGDGALCRLAETETDETASGVCDMNVCSAPRCGDHYVTAAEACDQSPPRFGTCVDLAYDYGRVGCDDQRCVPSITGCHQLGWDFQAVPGQGAIGAMWRANTSVWVANQNGVLQFDLVQQTWNVLGKVGFEMSPRGIWATHDVAGDHVFVVGNADANGGIAQLSDGVWSGIGRLPGASSDLGPLDAVWGRAADDVYAVGGVSDVPNGGPTGYGFVLHWDGVAWSEVAIPQGAHRLRAVWGIGNETYATGDHATILHRIGTGAWQDESPVGMGSAMFTGLWGTAGGSVFVVGNTILRRDPASGKFETFQAAPQNLDLRAITGRSETDAFAVGAVANRATILHFDGREWTRMVTPLDGRLQALNAVFADAEFVIAAQDTVDVIGYRQAGWTRSDAAPAQDVFGIHGDSDGHVVAVGSSCSIYEFTANAGWQAVDDPTTACAPTDFLSGAFSVSPSVAYAVGPNNHAARGDNGAWTSHTVDASLGDVWLWGVWAASPTDVFAVGSDHDNATVHILHGNGTASATEWTEMPAPAGVVLLKGVWGFGHGDVFAVGTKLVANQRQGTILHFNGTAWAEVTPQVAIPPLLAVWGASSTSVFAVGASGTILHYDGVAWSAMDITPGLTISTQVDLGGIFGTAADDVYATGAHTLLHYDGSGWTPIARVDGSTAGAVFATPNHVYLGGTAGATMQLVGTLAR